MSIIEKFTIIGYLGTQSATCGNGRRQPSRKPSVLNMNGNDSKFLVSRHAEKTAILYSFAAVAHFGEPLLSQKIALQKLCLRAQNFAAYSMPASALEVDSGSESSQGRTVLPLGSSDSKSDAIEKSDNSEIHHDEIKYLRRNLEFVSELSGSLVKCERNRQCSGLIGQLLMKFAKVCDPTNNNDNTKKNALRTSHGRLSQNFEAEEKAILDEFDFRSSEPGRLLAQALAAISPAALFSLVHALGKSHNKSIGKDDFNRILACFLPVVTARLTHFPVHELAGGCKLFLEAWGG